MKMRKFGLVGKSINYSLSKKLFDDSSFKDCKYELINTDKLSKELLLKYDGLNVTIPYKIEVINYLDEIDDKAKDIGSVNCIVNSNGILKGYNTDYYGIQETLKPYIDKINNVLVFGTGGVSKTLIQFCKDNNKCYLSIGRNKSTCEFVYEDLVKWKAVVSTADLIINATPVGTYPNVDDKLNVPYSYIKNNTVVFDLVYNPEETAFLKECKKYTNNIINGMTMLKKQAIESYKLWNLL